MRYLNRKTIRIENKEWVDKLGLPQEFLNAENWKISIDEGTGDLIVDYILGELIK